MVTVKLNKQNRCFHHAMRSLIPAGATTFTNSEKKYYQSLFDETFNCRIEFYNGFPDKLIFSDDRDATVFLLTWN